MGPSKKQVMSGGGDAEPTATKVQQSSWIQLDSIVIAALVFGIGLVVVVVNLLLEESRSDSIHWQLQLDNADEVYSMRCDDVLASADEDSSLFASFGPPAHPLPNLVEKSVKSKTVRSTLEDIQRARML